jgi:hypothetical protein
MNKDLVSAGFAYTSITRGASANVWSALVPDFDQWRLWVRNDLWATTSAERSSENATKRIETHALGTNENQSTSLKADRDTILGVMIWAQMLQLASTDSKRELRHMARQAEQNVLQAFASVESVALIYSDRLAPSQHFAIFIHGEIYDSALMDDLLDREYQLLQSLDPYPVSFRYMPYLSRTEAINYTSASSRLIFEG